MELNSPAAGRLYTSALDAAKPIAEFDVEPSLGADPEGFMDSLANAAEETVRTVAASEEATHAMMTGHADAHSVVEALAAAEMALEMAVAVRNKVVEAYQEILRMPI